MSKTQISLLIILIVLLFGYGWLFLYPEKEQPTIVIETPEEIITPVEIIPTSTQSIIGVSVENRDIEVFTFGNGEKNLLFVGGIHGGYEWNSIALAYEMIDHLNNQPEVIPSGLKIHIIPNLNPDGLYLATKREGRISFADKIGTNMHSNGLGRMNANKVDLNRNFACKWKPEGTWRGETVSAGNTSFSEPEAVALRDYVLAINPKTVVFWHSMAGSVYASECDEGILPETLTIMNAYATASNYDAVPVFDAYPVTGDAEGWLASIGIPAITVELGSRTSIEWSQNLAGTKALFELYTN